MSLQSLVSRHRSYKMENITVKIRWVPQRCPTAASLSPPLSSLGPCIYHPIRRRSLVSVPRHFRTLWYTCKQLGVHGPQRSSTGQMDPAAEQNGRYEEAQTKSHT